MPKRSPFVHPARQLPGIISQEELGQADFDPTVHGDADVVLVDESHNFRNPSSQRYLNLERLISQHAGRGRDGARKRIILLSATPKQRPAGSLRADQPDYAR
jgi:hypothetical protein